MLFIVHVLHVAAIGLRDMTVGAFQLGPFSVGIHDASRIEMHTMVELESAPVDPAAAALPGRVRHIRRNLAGRVTRANIVVARP